MPFIQTGSISNCEDFIRKYAQTYNDFGIRQSKIWPAGTLCISIAANIAKTGILAFEACFPDSVVGLVPAPGINVYYLHLWMQNIQARLEAFAPATAQKNINLEILHSVVVPLPPSEEQDAIVVAYKSAIDDMNDASIFAEDLSQRNSLRQSILKAAFEGRLIAQDPRDEPAERLLSRLSEQPEANGRANLKKTKLFARNSKRVIVGLDPAIHAAARPPRAANARSMPDCSMDARVEPAHDESKAKPT